MKLVPEFDQAFKVVEVKRRGPGAPNFSAYAERWAQSVQRECLGHFAVFGEARLRHLQGDYLAYYHRERPHQTRGNAPLGGALPPGEVGPAAGEVVYRPRLGGLLR